MTFDELFGWIGCIAIAYTLYSSFKDTIIRNRKLKKYESLKNEIQQFTDFLNKIKDKRKTGYARIISRNK